MADYNKKLLLPNNLDTLEETGYLILTVLSKYVGNNQSLILT